MRVWRKLHASILDSSDVAGLSDAAALLLTFLITAQDDTGYYPWNPTKIKRLTLTRNWSTERSQTLAEELCVAGITRFEEGGILLINGAKLNGKPRKGVEEESYPRNTNLCNPPQPADSLTTAIQQPDALEKRRGEGGTLPLEKSRVEKSRESGAKAPVVKLPEWVNKTLWERFLEMRKKIKATPTLYAQGLLIKTLTELKAQGNSPDAVLEQSIMNGWKGLFAVKNGGNNGTKYGRPGTNPAPYKDKPRTIYTLPEGPIVLGR